MTVCEFGLFAFGPWPCDLVGVWLDAGLFLAAITAAPMLYWQLHVQGRRERNWQTLAACRVYDIDPVIDRATREVYVATEGRTDFSKLSARHEAYRSTIVELNFLDGIAISVEQGVYDENIVKDHFESILPHAVRGMILGRTDPANPHRFVPVRLHDEADFASLVRLHHKWNPGDRASDRPRARVRSGP